MAERSVVLLLLVLPLCANATPDYLQAITQAGFFTLGDKDSIYVDHKLTKVLGYSLLAALKVHCMH